MNADNFRKFALSLPGAVESSHMNHPDFRIGGKIFATLGFPDDDWGMVKLSPDQQEQFVAADAESFRPCNGVWGRRGCTNVRLASAKKNIVKASIELAAENVLPAKAKNAKSTPPRKGRSTTGGSNARRRKSGGS
jgi:hypothetical protein